MIPTCQRCRRTLATGLWKLDGKMKFLCAGCGLGFYPTTKCKIELLTSFPYAASPKRCTGPLKPTGEVTKFDNGAIFLEMKCVQCDFSSDFLPPKAANATVRHLHTFTTASAVDSEQEVQLDEEGESSGSDLHSGALRARDGDSESVLRTTEGELDSTGFDGTGSERISEELDLDGD